MSEALVVAAPLRLEAACLRGTGLRVVRTGMGPARARAAAARLARDPARALAVAGLCGALDARLAPGDLVVADALVAPDGARVPLEAAPLLRALAALGLPARAGAVAGAVRPATGAARAALARSGALAVDMESCWLAPAAAGRPLAVLRVVLDGPARELWRADLPLRLARALRRLRAAAPALARWAAERAPAAPAADLVAPPFPAPRAPA